MQHLQDLAQGLHLHTGTRSGMIFLTTWDIGWLWPQTTLLVVEPKRVLGSLLLESLGYIELSLIGFKATPKALQQKTQLDGLRDDVMWVAAPSAHYQNAHPVRRVVEAHWASSSIGAAMVGKDNNWVTPGPKAWTHGSLLPDFISES